MMGKRNIILSAVLVFLIALAVSLSFWNRVPQQSFDSKKFAIEDINQINRIVMTTGEEVLDCRAFTRGFLINEAYAMDQSLLSVLAAVLQQVRVKRPVSEKQQPDIWKSLQTIGTHVEVFAGDQLLGSFWAGGDPDKQKSYFATETGEVFLVNLPGYNEYLSGLFELGLAGWRSKTIFQNTWRSILSLSLEDYHHPENNFRIDYSDPFFTVSGVQKLDSNRVIGYLENLGALTAQSLLDTTYQGKPWIKLTAVDIDEKKNLELTLYDSDSLILGKANDQYFWFEERKLQSLLRDANFFSRKD